MAKDSGTRPVLVPDLAMQQKRRKNLRVLRKDKADLALQRERKEQDWG